MLRGTKNHKFMYDLVVIGAGSGGVRAARISGGYGAKVALIESSLHHGPPTFTAVGGTCVNVGCVPKKLFVYGSHYSHHMHDAEGFGWKFPHSEEAVQQHHWQTLVQNKNKEIDRLNTIYISMLQNAGVDLIEATGKIVDKHTISCTDITGKIKNITAQTILIAVGGWPFKPEIKGIEHAITSNEAFYLQEKPKEIVIVGGGYIAVEFANIFHGFGSSVHLLYRSDLFLRGFDYDVRSHLADQMTAAGIKLHFNCDPTEIKRIEGEKLTVVCNNGEEISCDCVFYATGRAAKVEHLGLDLVNVATDSKGHIKVDEWSRTNVDNIYAVGDVTNRINLTPVALHEGHCFADSMYGPKGSERMPDHHNVCSAVFSDPEIGTVGYTEEKALKVYKGDLSVYTSTYMPLKHRLSGRSYRKDFMKVIVHDTTDKVVGLHLCCDSAAEMLQGFGVAVKMGATKKQFDATIGIHPTGAEELVTMRQSKYWYDSDGNKHMGQKPSNL